MGTNFYTLKGKHIGKRSAAGLYCWDCGITLCAGGIELLHSGESYFHRSCPRCGRTHTEEDLDNSSVGRELGFNKSIPHRKIGVRSCSSFIWGIQPEETKRLKVIKDEYGRRYTKEEWRQVLEECPIQFFDSIGIEFS